MKRENLAERVGFEPTSRFLVNTLSKRAPSATRTPLRVTSREANLHENLGQRFWQVCGSNDFRAFRLRIARVQTPTPGEQPLTTSIQDITLSLSAPVAQMDRAVASGATGRGFESLQAYQLTPFCTIGSRFSHRTYLPKT